jgi:ubiquinone/menaquinone biosynthesis C-methylase UbiE
VSNDRNSVQDWWATNPMTYGTVHGAAEYGEKKIEIGSKEFFNQVDHVFCGWNPNLHATRPFDRLFPYDEYAKGGRVLEIGCGMGTMAMNWARNGSKITAVDLNATSIAQTQRRFDLFGLQGDIRQMDANTLQFPDGEFDYVYSWGVLHHSPDLAKSLTEMMRVLRKGGGFGLMLYSRESILYKYRIRYLEGFLHLENRFSSPLGLASRYTDGAETEGNPHTWPVTDSELKAMLSPYSRDLGFRRFGEEVSDIFKYLLPGLSALLPRSVVRTWSRHFGWSTWASGHKD